MSNIYILVRFPFFDESKYANVYTYSSYSSKARAEYDLKHNSEKIYKKRFKYAVLLKHKLNQESNKIESYQFYVYSEYDGKYIPLNIDYKYNFYSSISAMSLYV